MALNLHATVRAAIQSVNPDISAAWLVSTGSTADSAGKQTPTYAAPVTIRAQVQPVAGDDLKQIDYLNMQGIFRNVYAFGDIEGIVRPDLKGGDMLQFPMTVGGATRAWLVVHVLESWVPDAAGWCSVIVALQEDAVP